MSSPSSADEAVLPPPASLAIHLDLVGGLAGDMFVAAMVDALPALKAPVLAELAAVQTRRRAGAGHSSKRSSGGLRAQRFGLARDPHPPDSLPCRAGPRHGRGYGSGGCTCSMNMQAPRTRCCAAGSPRRRLTPPTREHALALLALLADAEARVHGIPVDDVHFHELADWDSLLDVVAAGCIAAQLDGARWTASALPLGGGTVRTAHGLLPVPAPATSLLLTGYPWHDDGIAGERVTPTGAAILRHLVPAAQCGARRDAGRLLSVGSGAGTRALPGLPNIVRALVLERVAAAEADADVGDGARVRRRRHDGRGDRRGGRSPARGARRGRRVGRHAARQEGTAARRFPAAGATARGRRDRAGLLHRNVDAGTALARGAPARAAPNRGHGDGRRRHGRASRSPSVPAASARRRPRRTTSSRRPGSASARREAR